MLDTMLMPASHLASELSRLEHAIETLKPVVDSHITGERVARYLTAIANTPAPSTAASAMRTPVLRRLLQEDGAIGDRLWLGGIELGGGTLHWLSLLYAASGSLMISRIRIPKF